MPRGYAEHYRDRIGPGSVAAPSAQQAIIAAVCAGDVIVPTPYDVLVSDGTHELRLQSGSDALKIGTETDNVRPIVSHKTTQALADILDMIVPTPKMADLLADQAPWQIDASKPSLLEDGGKRTCCRGAGRSGGNFIRPESSMTGAPIPMSRDGMEEEDDRIDAYVQALSGFPFAPPRLPLGLALNQTGKIWVTHPQLLNGAPQQGMNYGFHTKGGPHPTNNASKLWRVIQGGKAGQSIFHDYNHTDYSQRALLFFRQAWIRGGRFGSSWNLIDVDDVATDPDLAHLVIASGQPMKLRHPHLPRYECDGGYVAPLPTKPGGGGASGPPPPGWGPSPPPTDPSPPKDGANLLAWFLGLGLTGAAMYHLTRDL